VKELAKKLSNGICSNSPLKYPCNKISEKFSKGDAIEYGMQERAKLGELLLFISGLRQKGDVLRVLKLSFVIQAIARLLFPRRYRENLR
jgi:hypothetical protein